METDLFLFLNKKDLFKDKIARVDLKCAAPSYTGGCDYDSALAFIENQCDHGWGS